MDESADLPVTLPSITFLREVAIEGHELHAELRAVGFSDKQATAIVGQMIADAVNSRDEEYYEVEFVVSDEDDLDEDDTYDDGDAS